jgi:hypothetical protein
MQMQGGTLQWGTMEYIFAGFAIATAVGVLLQACILAGFFFAFRRILGKVEVILGHVTNHALPLIESSKVTLEELAPKVQIISSNLTEISELLKEETHTIKGSVDDVVAKTRAQTARVDEMVSGTLDGVSQAASVIQDGIEVPLRHIHGIFNGLKAGFGTFKSKSAHPPIPVPVEEPLIVIVEEAVATEGPLV